MSSSKIDEKNHLVPSDVAKQAPENHHKYMPAN